MGLWNSPVRTVTTTCVITVRWPCDVASRRCRWCGLVWSCVMGCVTSMVDERGGGCGQRAALRVVDGRDGGG